MCWKYKPIVWKEKIAKTWKFDKKQTFSFKLTRQCKTLSNRYKELDIVMSQHKHITIPKQKEAKVGIIL